MKNLLVILTLVLLFGISSKAQDLHSGFNYLEAGKFNEAEEFFFEILETYPENKTAKICYGRAIGLNGKTQEAQNLFLKLLDRYPFDLEISLNYAESMMWNNQFEEAKELYEKILEKDSGNFVAHLGYANSLAKLKRYPQAMKYILLALEIKPRDKGALNSKKYIRLAYAYNLSLKKDFDQAILLLKGNLSDLPGDGDSMLSLADIYLNSEKYELAIEIYNELVNTQKKRISALNGLALVNHKRGKDKDALDFAERAYNYSMETEDSTQINRAVERYIQALIWNGKYRSARKKIDLTTQKYGNLKLSYQLNAMHFIYTGHFKNAVAEYKRLLQLDSVSFDGNLGVANAYFANSELKKSSVALSKALSYFPQQNDVLEFEQKLTSKGVPYLEDKVAYSYDNGKNIAYLQSVLVTFPLSWRLTLGTDYHFRRTKNTISNRDANTSAFDFRLHYQLTSSLKLKAKGGIVLVNLPEDAYSNFVTDLSIELKPFALQYIEFGYRNEIQNYNVDLLGNHIRSDHYFVKSNIASNFKLGWYNQYYFTSQSDNNTRNLWFSSVYYQLMSKPILKLGVNYQNIQFKESRSAIYFSPEKYNAYEIFIDLLKDGNNFKKAHWFYGFTVAGGIQKIDRNKAQATYRFNASIAYKISERVLFKLYGMQSNIASTTASGYNYNEFGFQLNWRIFKNPIFKYH